VSFSTDLAKLVSDQVSRFVTLNRHQLAGHVANLDFWTDQVRHCLAAIDGYERRFQQLKTAQAQHIAEHRTIEFSLSDPCDMGDMPARPSKVPIGELEDARRTLCEATRSFLRRCLKEGFITETVFRKACEDSGIGLDLILLAGE